MSLFIDVVVLLLAIGVCVAAVCVAAWLWVSGMGTVGVRVAGSVAAFFVLAAAFTVLVATSNGDDDGVHEWRGGSGPDTVCDYEVRSELVGKIVQNITYTVCRDAGASR